MAPITAPVPSTLLDGIPVSRLGFKESLTRLESWLDGASFRRVATANTDFLRQAEKHPELQTALRSASLVTADGMPLVWLSHLSNRPIRERVAGSDLILPLMERAAERGVSVFRLGSSPKVLHKVRKKLASRLPKLQIAGTYSENVNVDDVPAMKQLAAKVRASEAGLLLVALGCPKQELFLSRYGADTGVKVGIGIGASLDFLSGSVRRAPSYLRETGLEWFPRFVQEPRRLGMRYLRSAAYLIKLSTQMLFASARAGHPTHFAA